MGDDLSLRAKAGRLVKGGLAGALLLALVWQAMGLVRQSGDLWRRKIAVNLRADQYTRGADAAAGGDFALLVGTLRQEIPEDGHVVLPPNGGRFFLNSGGFMQFFLFPRTVQPCPDPQSESCRASLGNGSSYVIAFSGFPDASGLSEALIYIPIIGDELGLYAPADDPAARNQD